ncbi:thioredoxin-like protein [Trichoderma austrokoningii]
MATSLNTGLQAVAKSAQASMPKTAKKIIADARASVGKQFDAKATIQPGQKMPEFALSDARGVSVSSVDLLAKGPLLIVFYRGGWCPFCNLTLRAYQQRLEDFKARGVTLVAITPEQPDSSLSTAEKNELQFPVLTDDGLELARKLNITWEQPKELVELMKDGMGNDLKKRHGNDSHDQVVPTTLLVDQEGVVRNIFAEADWATRLEPQEAVNWVNAL